MPRTVTNPDPLYTADEAGRYLGLDRLLKNPGQTVRRLCRLGVLPHVQMSHRIWIRKSRLDQWIEEQEAKG